MYWLSMTALTVSLCAYVMQVQAIRAVEKYLGLEKLYVLGTNCVDNGPRQGLEKFLKAASTSPDTVLHYEFMQVQLCLSLWSRHDPVLSPALQHVMHSR